MFYLHPTYVISHSMSETTCTLWMKLVPSCSSSMVARLEGRKRESKQEAVYKKTPTPVHPTPSSHSIHPDLHPLIPKFSKLTPVGFEPTQLALVELESTPLDHSGKVSWVRGVRGGAVRGAGQGRRCRCAGVWLVRVLVQVLRFRAGADAGAARTE